MENLNTKILNKGEEYILDMLGIKLKIDKENY